VAGTSTVAAVGGLVGFNEGSIAQSSRIGGIISGTGSAGQNVLLGGLVGSNNGPGTIQTSTTSGVTINGTNATAGGLAAINNGQITGVIGQTTASNNTITLNGANSNGG